MHNIIQNIMYTLPETNNSPPENQWLENEISVLGRSIFSGELLEG